MLTRTGIRIQAFKVALFLFITVVMVLAVVGTAAATPVNVTLTVHNSSGAPLDGVKVYYNDYGSHWVLLGTTSGGNPVTTAFADGSYNFKAVKDHTEQVKNVVVSVTGSTTFQTSEFVVHVTDSSTVDLTGTAVAFNDYGSHYLGIGNTDTNGKASIELFSGTRKFKATKNNTYVTGDLAIGTAGATDTIEFQTSEFVVHVTDSSTANLPGTAVAFNDYGSHYLSMGSTDGAGLASIELFPGTRKFKATKNNTYVAGDLAIGAAGATDTIEFQTSEFVVHVTDSSTANLPGTAVAFNDYGSHYLSMGSTDGAGKASIELFPGTRKFKATKNHSYVTGDLTIGTAGASDTIEFQTAKFTVHVKDSSGADFPGIVVSYNDYGSHYLNMGGTDANGNSAIELFPGTYKFKAYKDHTEVTGDLANNVSGSNETIDFQTAKAVALVKDCDGTPLAGFKITFNDYGSHWLNVGTTGGDGKASTVLFPGTRKMRAAINNTYAVQDLALTLTESTAEFNPTKVDWQYSGTIKYNDYGSHWKTMTTPFYMFAGTYDFKFDGVQTSVTISGCSSSGAILLITLKDSAGNGVANGTAHLGVGGWPVIGTTDANGNLVYFHNGSLGNMQIRMDAPFYGGTETSPSQNTALNSVYNFQTQQVTIQLKDSAGTLTDGGLVYAGVGGWPFIGTTGDDGLGTLYHEHFAGTFKYRMTFNSTTEEQQHDVSTPFIFQTVQAEIQLLDHNGSPLNGGIVRFGVGGWPVIGTTGDAGPGKVQRELFAGSYNFRMTYNYATEEKNANIASPVVFQTALVDLQFSGSIQHSVGGWPNYVKPTEMLPVSQGYGFTGCGYPRQLLSFTPTAGTVFAKSIVFASFKNSGGGGLAGGAYEYRFGFGPYSAMGSTPANGLIVYAIDGLQTNTKFRVSYAGGTTGDSQQNIATNSCVNFQTVPVTAVLNSSSNNPIVSGVTFEYRYGFDSYQTFNSPMELLPLNTKIKVHYGGAAIEKEQDTNSNPNFVFATVSVTAVLNESGGSLLGGASFKYRYGFDSYQTFTSPMELLPVNTKIKVEYAGAGVEKEQNANSSPNFVFATVSVGAVLNDSTGSPLGGAAYEYRYGFDSYQAFTSPMELLPVNTKIKVNYGGAAVEKEQNVNSSPSFAFQTGNVTSTTCTKYRYGFDSYMGFTSPMQLLPVLTKFSDAGGPDVPQTPTPGGTINVTCN